MLRRRVTRLCFLIALSCEKQQNKEKKRFMAHWLKISPKSEFFQCKKKNQTNRAEALNVEPDKQPRHICLISLLSQ